MVLLNERLFKRVSLGLAISDGRLDFPVEFFSVFVDFWWNFLAFVYIYDYVDVFALLGNTFGPGI